MCFVPTNLFTYDGDYNDVYTVTNEKNEWHSSSSRCYLIFTVNVNPFTADPVKALHFAILV